MWQYLFKITFEHDCFDCFFFGFQGHHFMIATLPAPPYINEMIPVGYTVDGSMKYTITGFFAEVFDNLQVSKADSKRSILI